MARIVSYEIEGLAGRRKTVARTLGPINVFWGHNGAGKTSLLKILHSALANDATTLLRLPFRSASVVIEDEVTERHFTRSISKPKVLDSALRDLAGLEPEFVARHIRELRKEMSDNWITTPQMKSPRIHPSGYVRHGYLPISRISDSRTRRPGGGGPVRELVDEASFDKIFASQVTELWRDFSARASMRVTRAQELGIARILASVLSPQTRSLDPWPASKASEAFSMVSEFLARQRLGRHVRLDPDAFAANFESNTLVQQVVAHVADVQKAVDLALAPQFQVETLLNELYFGRKRVNLEARDIQILSGGDFIPLESLSSGEKQLMQMLLEVLAAGENPVIIDEPELSLHVDWQRSLVRYFTQVNDEAQIVMATHSPEVLARLQDSAVIELA